MTSPEFELAMTKTEYDAAIKSLAAASKLAARYQGERDAALAAVGRVRSLAETWTEWGDETASNMLRDAIEGKTS